MRLDKNVCEQSISIVRNSSHVLEGHGVCMNFICNVNMNETESELAVVFIFTVV